MQTHLQTRAEKSLGLSALLEVKMWYEATSRGSGLVNKSAGKDGRGVSAEILVLTEKEIVSPRGVEQLCIITHGR